MMILLLDAGNTRLKWATIESNANPLSQSPPELSNQGSVNYQWSSLAGQLDNALKQISDSPASLSQILLSNVAGPRLESALEIWLKGYLRSRRADTQSRASTISSSTLLDDKSQVKENAGLTIDKVTAQTTAFGVANAYDEPSQLGADRWAALVAARHFCAGPACIIDSGTALTVDLISKEGQHAGGLILPGITLMTAALVENTDAIQAGKQGQLTVFEVHSTEDAVKAGVHAAILGAITHVLAEAREKWGVEPQCVVTGGNAGSLKTGLPESSRHDPDWVLKGLAVIAGINRQG